MITGTDAEYQPDARYTEDNPYLALTGELWVVFCECLWENWPRYNGTALFLVCDKLLLFIHAPAHVPICSTWFDKYCIMSKG